MLLLWCAGSAVHHDFSSLVVTLFLTIPAILTIISKLPTSEVVIWLIDGTFLINLPCPRGAFFIDHK
jgi:hypothetical protein